MHSAVTHRRIYEALWTIKENLTVDMSGGREDLVSFSTGLF